MEPSQQARANFHSNRDAIAAIQPWLVSELSPALSVFVHARDGALTALQQDGLWLGSCSVPRAAAREQLKTLQFNSNVACFLDPTHGQHLLVAMELLRCDQALIALCPDARLFNLALHCGDLSQFIADRRLFFCPGARWAEHLRRTLEENPGLPIPAAFVRTNLCGDGSLQERIQQAQKIFSDVSLGRSAELVRLRSVSRGLATPRRLLVVAPSRFRLWDDAGQRLDECLTSNSTGALQVQIFDPDRPVSASPLALAQAISRADAMIAANIGRADLTAVAPASLPWITLITQPRIPAHQPGSPFDRLVLSDARWTALAASAGWPASAFTVATLPPVAADPAPADAPLAMIADTSDTAAAAEKFDYSSHRLLWELVESELSTDPLRAGRDPLAYLDPILRRLGIASEAFDFPYFIDHLLVPCYQQNLARHLLAGGVRLALWGEGWQTLSDLALAARGPVPDRSIFSRALQDSSAIIHCWPVAGPHPADGCGRPVIRPDGSIKSLIQQLRGPIFQAMSPSAAINVDLVRSWLG